MAKIIVVDSDSIYAIYNPNDPLNARAVRTLNLLVSAGYKLIYPVSVVFEIISLFQRVLPKPTITAKLTEMVIKGELIVYPIDAKVLKKSADLFKPAGSKKNTLTDCSVVVIAKEVKAAGVFSYDNFYRKHSLKFAENLVT